MTGCYLTRIILTCVCPPSPIGNKLLRSPPKPGGRRYVDGGVGFGVLTPSYAGTVEIALPCMCDSQLVLFTWSASVVLFRNYIGGGWKPRLLFHLFVGEYMKRLDCYVTATRVSVFSFLQLCLQSALRRGLLSTTGNSTASPSRIVFRSVLFFVLQ